MSLLDLVCFLFSLRSLINVGKESSMMLLTYANFLPHPRNSELEALEITPRNPLQLRFMQYFEVPNLKQELKINGIELKDKPV